MRLHRHTCIIAIKRSKSVRSQKLLISPLTPLLQIFFDLRIFSNFLLSELINDLNYRTYDKRKEILKEIFLRNLWDFHAEIVRIFSKKYLKDLHRPVFISSMKNSSDTRKSILQLSLVIRLILRNSCRKSEQ